MEGRRARYELDRGVCVLSRIRTYQLASATASFLLQLAAALQGAEEGRLQAIGEGLVPVAAALTLAWLVCFPLQTKLETYRRFLDEAD